MVLKISKCFAFRSQVYETWFARVITPLCMHRQTCMSVQINIHMQVQSYVYTV